MEKLNEPTILLRVGIVMLIVPDFYCILVEHGRYVQCFDEY